MSSSQLPVVMAYVDGSAKPTNPGFGGAGMCMVWPDGKVSKRYVAVGSSVTNNVCELQAIYLALQFMHTHRHQRTKKAVRMVIVTDSKYAIGVVSGAMKAKLNKELVATIQRQLASFRAHVCPCDFEWVKGHNKEPGNEQADALARMGSDRSQENAQGKTSI